MGSEEASAFDDADQLDAMIQDSRALDKRRKSSIADARATIESFALETDSGAWASLDRAAVAERLLELIGPVESDDDGQPDQAGRAIFQGSLNLCGPAAFFQCVIKRHPVMFANFATSLFNNGRASLGRLRVSPNEDITGSDYNDIVLRMGDQVCPQADWMVLGALRNSTNAFWTGSFQGTPEEVIAAGTRPDELADWLTKTGIYKSVSNQANWMTSAGIPHATNLPDFEGNDLIALINADLIANARNLPGDSSWPMTAFPNHWVVVISGIMSEVVNDAVYFPIWTWGSAMTLDVPTQSFVDNYYGALVCKMGPQVNS